MGRWPPQHAGTAAGRNRHPCAAIPRRTAEGGWRPRGGRAMRTAQARADRWRVCQLQGYEIQLTEEEMEPKVRLRPARAARVAGRAHTGAAAARGATRAALEAAPGLGGFGESTVSPLRVPARPHAAQKQPVEFDQAISYVNKIKTRFQARCPPAAGAPPAPLGPYHPGFGRQLRARAPTCGPPGPGSRLTPHAAARRTTSACTRRSWRS